MQYLLPSTINFSPLKPSHPTHHSQSQQFTQPAQKKQ